MMSDDVAPQPSEDHDGIAIGESTARAVAGYLAKYVTKALTLDTPAGRSTTGIMDRAAHYEQIIETCLVLAGDPELRELRLLRHLHTLGCGTHICTRSRGYSSTLKKLRAEQQEYAAAKAGISMSDTVIARSYWEYVGSGWISPEQATYAAARASEKAAERQRLKDSRQNEARRPPTEPEQS